MTMNVYTTLTEKATCPVVDIGFLSDGVYIVHPLAPGPVFVQLYYLKVINSPQ